MSLTSGLHKKELIRGGVLIAFSNVERLLKTR